MRWGSLHPKRNIPKILSPQNPKISLENLLEILGEPWALANNNLKLRRAFSKVGIFPLNRYWLSQNQHFILLNLQGKIEKFDELSNQHKKSNSMAQLIQRADYLGLASEDQYKMDSIPQKLPLTRSLLMMLEMAKTHLSKIQNHDQKRRTNMIEEYIDDSRFLSDQERIKRLIEELAKNWKKSKKKKRIEAKPKNDFQSQTNSKKRKCEKTSDAEIRGFNAKYNDGVQEILYKKTRTDSKSDD